FHTALSELPVRIETVLVINGCSDRSQEICEELAREDSRVTIHCTSRAGWGHAVQEGLARAKGDLLCYTNSARTSPEELAQVVRFAIAYPGVIVKANRKLRESLVRRIGSLLYNLECRTLFDLATWDVNGTPKIFPREYSPLLALRSPDDLIDVEFGVICRRMQYAMVEVPIFSVRRHGGKSTTNWNSALHLYWGAMKAWLTKRWM